MTRAALYLRVSREDLSLENQRPALERLCAARDFEVVATYEEHASAAAKVRPEYNRMLEDARAGTFRSLVVWSIDRFGRSMYGNLRDVVELERLGVRLVSVQETWLDTAGPARELLIAVISWVAEQERLRIVARTKAGIARAKKAGKHCGRPPRVTPELARRAARLVDEGRSQRSIAQALKVPRTTVQAALRLAKETPCPSPVPLRTDADE